MTGRRGRALARLAVGLTWSTCLVVVAWATSGCDTGERERLQAELDACESKSEERLETWRQALQEANDTIDELNGAIELAQLYAGSSNEEMEFALLGLQTGSTTDEPE